MLNKFFEVESFDFDKERKNFIDNLNFLKSMSVQELTLYKKWQEFNKDVYSMQQKSSHFEKIENSLWMPSDIYNQESTIREIEELDPVVEHIDPSDSNKVMMWTLLRRLIHTMEYTANPGRNVKFLVRDKTSNKILGVICLGSDIISIAVRDSYIGWSKDNKLKDKKLRYTAIGTTICCTQPSGFNFLGGKLVAALVTSSVVRDTWKKLYNETLVGITTTSLYGIHSMYNSIPQWKTLGESKGKIILKPDDSAYSTWHQWLKDNRSEIYKKATTQKKKVEKKVAVPVVNCRCGELEARIAGLENKSSLVSRLREAVNGLLLQQANGRKNNIRKV